MLIFKVIKKPDDKSTLIISGIIILGICIKFFEITMENILIKNNDIVMINYLSPIIITLLIISFLFINLNFLQERIKK